MRKFSFSIAALFCVAALSFTGGCKFGTPAEPTMAPTVSAAPSATPEPTVTTEPPEAPSTTPTEAPTKAVTPTPSPEPAEAPTVTPTPSPEPTPTNVPTPTATLAPTATPKPTATPTPARRYETGTIEDLLDQITFTGASFAAIDGNTGEPILSYNDTLKRRPASLTKMMTAIVAYENLPLDAKLTVTAESLRWHDRFDEDGTMIYRGLDNEMYTEDSVEGTTYTLSDWLKLLMMRSDAAAADTIALGVAGSYETFSDLMNAKAKELGMNDTYFDNPVGADFWINEETGEYDYNFDLITTAEDFAILTKAYMDNDFLAEVAGTWLYMLPPSLDGSIEKTRKLTNFNRLMNAKDNPQFASTLFTVIGTKTGFTDEAGRTIAATAVDKKGHKVCLVYMSQTLDNSQNYYTQSYDILDYIFRYCLD